jgi:hypothetical protein
LNTALTTYAVAGLDQLLAEHNEDEIGVAIREEIEGLTKEMKKVQG